jgi:alkanesulfonate monooxygenase SsuD/methylene tetrahydromethanopterin reductase-like flavin-dependent oxidoreductase (luciferase family)
MKFGLTPREWGDFIDDALLEARLAHGVGFDSIFIEEHHQNPSYLPSPIMALASIGSSVPEMYLGTAVAILPLYHPIRFSEDVSVLTQVAKGKVILGVSVGYRETDFQNLGIALKERGARMDEALEILNRVFSGGKVSFNGRFYKFSDYTLEPKPYGGRRPEVWIGGWKEAAISRAAKHGDYWFPGPVGTFKVVEDALNLYKEKLNSYGKEFRGFPLMRDAHVAETDDRALQNVKFAVQKKYEEDYSSSGHPLVGGKSAQVEEWVYDRFMIGSPDTVIETIERFRKQGCIHLVLRMAMPYIRLEDTLEAIKLFGEKVIPYFKTAN